MEFDFDIANENVTLNEKVCQKYNLGELVLHAVWFQTITWIFSNRIVQLEFRKWHFIEY